MNIYSLSKYIKYCLFSAHKRGHGIHSPFVFNLITKVFRNKINPEVVFNIEKIRQEMISDNRKINVTDYGSGSERMKSNLRKVSEIAKYSAVPRKYGILLAQLSEEFGKSDILELGTSLGLSTMYMAAGSPGVVVHTIEGCPETSEIAKSNFERSGLKNIRIYTGSFEEMLPEIEQQKIRPGLVFIDGDHRKEPVLNYFYKIAGMADSKCVIVFDDIYSSSEMGEAWDEIKFFKKVTLTVDIFRMGLVFFREGITRSDYIVRY
jgi:predicted O-methyltransferase YrrM